MLIREIRSDILLGTAMTLTAFSAPGQFYRGNLHGHTSASDGELSVEDLAAFLADSGPRKDHKTFGM